MFPRFCIACGDRLQPQEIEGRSRQVCPSCAHIAWENPVPAAAVAVCRQREVLLCRRTISPYEGLWGLPAGYQEVDETIEATAIREVREETGLIVKLTGLVDVFTTPDDPRKPSLLVVYGGEEVDGELEPGDECSEVAWVSLDELPRDIAFANNRAVLERLRTGESRAW